MTDVWRDVDGERWAFGFVIRRSGLQVQFGRRMYRLRWGA